jgi:hypothetical protein
MMLAEFDARRFADEVAAKVEAEGKGAISRALRRTGISTATFNRMLHGTPPRNIDAIMSAAAHFGLRLIDYVKIGGSAPASGGLSTGLAHNSQGVIEHPNARKWQ